MDSIQFYWVNIEYDTNVLTPRLETEVLVRVCLQKFANSADVVIDIWTGSWAIITALAKALLAKKQDKEYSFYWSDISHAACEVAKKNITRNALPISIEQWDLLTPWLLDAQNGMFSQRNILCVANLPYIAEGECIGADVAEEDPKIALYGWGEDWFECIRRYLSMVSDFSCYSGGCISVLEFWHTQADIFVAYAVESWLEYGIFCDQSGVYRFWYCILKPFYKDTHCDE
jgi:methylase of polypeptide subunit release factors